MGAVILGIVLIFISFILFSHFRSLSLDDEEWNDFVKADSGYPTDKELKEGLAIAKGIGYTVSLLLMILGSWLVWG